MSIEATASASRLRLHPKLRTLLDAPLALMLYLESSQAHPLSKEPQPNCEFPNCAEPHSMHHQHPHWQHAEVHFRASGSAYERTTFSDDFGLPQQLPYPAPGPSQVQAHAFEPPRVQSAAQLQAGWPAVASSGGPATTSVAAAYDHDEDRGSRARELHEAEYPYDTPAGSARAPGPGRER